MSDHVVQILWKVRVGQNALYLLKIDCQGDDSWIDLSNRSLFANCSNASQNAALRVHDVSFHGGSFHESALDRDLRFSRHGDLYQILDRIEHRYVHVGFDRDGFDRETNDLASSDLASSDLASRIQDLFDLGSPSCAIRFALS